MDNYIISMWRTDDGLYCVDYISPSVGMTLYTSLDRQGASDECDRLNAMTPTQMHDYIISR